jgi:hypothetical protein
LRTMKPIATMMAAANSLIMTMDLPEPMRFAA